MVCKQEPSECIRFISSTRLSITTSPFARNTSRLRILSSIQYWRSSPNCTCLRNSLRYSEQYFLLSVIHGDSSRWHLICRILGSSGKETLGILRKFDFLRSVWNVWRMCCIICSNILLRISEGSWSMNLKLEGGVFSLMLASLEKRSLTFQKLARTPLYTLMHSRVVISDLPPLSHQNRFFSVLASDIFASPSSRVLKQTLESGTPDTEIPERQQDQDIKEAAISRIKIQLQSPSFVFHQGYLLETAT